MTKQKAQCSNTSLSIKTNEVKFFKTFSLDDREGFSFCIDIGSIFLYSAAQYFQGKAKSSVFFAENGGSLKTCWENWAQFYFPARSQQDFLASDFHFHTGYSTGQLVER